LPRRLEERFARYREGRGETPNAEQIEASRRSVGGLCAIIDALAADAERWPEQRTWSDHVEFLREVAERWLKGFGRELDHPAIAAILSVLTDLGQLDALQRKAPNPRVVLETLERRLESAALPLGRRVGEGVQVLDMMQARGLSFDHLFLIGLNSDLWPRRARRDPFLPEEVRRRLATRPGCSLSPKLDGAEEERLLLAMTLDSARRSLTVSYQRADPLGSAKVPALAFRELARLLHGDPDPALALPSGDQRERVPAHPSQLWRRSSRASGLRASRAAAAAALLLPRKLSAAAAIDLASPRQRQTLAAGLTLLVAIERWHDEELAYDAVLPPGLLAPRRPFSPTRLQTYGRCPLQYFLIEGLRVKELEDPEGEELLPVVELGRAAHELLEQVYRDLMPLLGTSERPLDWEAASRRADQLLDQHWESAFGAIGRRLSDKLPLLWNRTLSRWRQALHAGIRDDLREMAEERWRPLQLEVELQGNFGAELHGFVDRLDVGPRGRLRVVDYKTSGNLERRVDPKLILLGEQVQLPAYIEMARSAHHTEVIGLLLPIGPEIDRQQRQDFKFENDALRQGLRETLELFDREIELGHFPLQKGTHCNWCAYLGGCRRNHPATVERSATARAFATWRRLRSKTPENPLLRHT
jgi:RecB family exonuclease